MSQLQIVQIDQSKYEFLSNLYDPTRQDAYGKHCLIFGQDRKESWDMHLAWLQTPGFVISDPKETLSFSVEEIIQLGYVGLWKLKEKQDEQDS